MPTDALEPVRASREFWQRADVFAALDTRDIGALFRLLRQHTGASQTRIGISVGMPQSEISLIMSTRPRQRRVTALTVLARIADGLHMPGDARSHLGLAHRASADVSIVHNHEEDETRNALLPSGPASQHEARPADQTSPFRPAPSATVASDTADDPDRATSSAFGTALRSLRALAGLSQSALAQHVKYSKQVIGHLETGYRSPTREMASALDQALNANGRLIELAVVQRNGQPINRSRASLSQNAESSAERLSVPVRTDDGRVILVPLSRRAFIGALGAGLAITSAPHVPMPMDVARLSAQANSGANPIELFEATWSVLIDNDNIFGARGVVPLVEKQISRIRQLRGERRGADRQRLFEMQGRFSEFCGWLYQDLGEFVNAKRSMQEALEAAYMSGNRDLTTYILARRSQLAGDMLDSVEAVDMAEAAEASATPGTKLAAIATTYAAHGYALRGDTVAANNAYDRVHNLTTSVVPEPASPWGAWLDSAYVEAQRAHSLTTLGESRRAAKIFDVAITQLPVKFHRDRGVYLARAAVALATAGQPEEAALSGLQALTIGVATGSARISSQLAQLDADFDSCPVLPAVAEFKQALSNAVIQSIAPPQVQHG